MKRTVPLSGGVEQLFGTLDENLKLLERALHVSTHLKDNTLEIEGESADVERAARLIGEYGELVREGRVFSNGDVKALFRVAIEEPGVGLRKILESSRTFTFTKDVAASIGLAHDKPRAFGKKTITPKSANQRRYIECIEKFDMVFAIGPGGTGKTYLAVAMAVSALQTKQVNRIILARPAVEAGERLGFLPGTLQ